MAEEVQTETVTAQAASETQAAAQPKPTLEELQAQVESANKRIKELNAESAKHRRAAEAAQKAEEDRKAAEMSETDKLKAEVEKLAKANEQAQALANERLIKAAIISKASTLNFADPADAVTMLDKSKLTINDAGDVDGVEDALKELLKAKPYLAKKASAVVNPTNPGGAQAGTETIEQRRNRIMGGGGNSMYDRAEAEARGGGVVFTQKGQ